MIDVEAFDVAWGHLTRRFGKDKDDAGATAMGTMYFEFLTEQMDTESFLAAARALWATAKWFPRPADFLTLGAAGEWTTVVECIDGYRQPDFPWTQGWPDGRPAPWPRLSPRAQAACKFLGGIPGMKGLYERDPSRAKAEWEKALEQTTVDSVLQLAAAGRFKALPAAPYRRADGTERRG